MKDNRRFGIGFLIICLTGYACKPLKEVNQFATTCQTSLDAGNLTGYGYYEYAYDSAYIFNTTGKYLSDLRYDSSYGRLRDSLVSTEYHALSAYFAALAKLAGNSSIMNFAPVAAAVPAGAYGELTISDRQSAAVTALATVATDLLTTHYKSKKIKEIIVEYHDTVKIAIGLLALHLTNLENLIRNMEDKLKNRTRELLLNAGTDGERWAIIYAYKQKAHEFDSTLPAYEKRRQCLTSIDKGNDSLYEKVDDLRSESLKQSVLALARNIIYLSGK